MNNDISPVPNNGNPKEKQLPPESMKEPCPENAGIQSPQEKAAVQSLSEETSRSSTAETDAQHSAEEVGQEEPSRKVRVRWHGIHPLFIVVPIALVVTLAVLLIIYFTTKQSVGEVRTTLYVNGLLPVAVQTETADGTTVQWGYIDKAGEFVIPAQYLSARIFASNGLAAVETAEGWGYINRDGEIVIAAQYEGAATFSDSGYAAVKRNGSWGYIKKNGDLLVNPQFDEAYPFGDEGLALVMIGGKYGYINRAGRYVIVPRFEKAQSFRPDGYAPVFEFGYWGVINSKGEYVINPQFDSISEFSGNGLALVEKDGKYGYIDKKGVYVILPAYDYAESFAENGLALVEKDGVYGFINKANELVLSGYANACSFGDNGTAPVQTVANGTWHYIDRNGEPINEQEYADAQTFSYGLALTMNQENRLVFTDEKGKNLLVCPENCLTATKFSKDGFSLLICLDADTLKQYYMLINSKGDVLLTRAEAICLE